LDRAGSAARPGRLPGRQAGGGALSGPVLSVVAVVRTSDTLGPFAGTIEPRFKSDLGFRLFGRMVARFVDVGAVVTRDQELAALDPAVQALGGAQRRGHGRRRRGAIRQRRGRGGRQRDLAQRNITAAGPVRADPAQPRDRRGNLTRARASLRKAKDLLSFTQLKADFDGVVTGRYAEPGQVVNAGQKIVTVARPEIREAVIAVANELADALSHPNAFTMTVDLDHVVSMKAAAVRSIDPTADSSTRMRGVFLTLDDPPAAFRLGITIGVTLTRPVVAAHRPAGNRAGRQGRQVVRLAGRPGQEHGGAARRDGPGARRRHGDRHGRQRRGRARGRRAHRHRRRAQPHARASRQGGAV